MRITFFVNRLNHHQAPVADELFCLIGDSFRFVETCVPNEQSKKGSTEDFSSRPYLIQAWNDKESKALAKKLAIESDVAVFGAESIDFEVLRMKSSNKLAFEMSERWLKRGGVNIFSPRLMKYQWYYHTLFYNKSLYKLCMGGFCANDMYALRSFIGKCYKWGYFTNFDDKTEHIKSDYNPADTTKIMWCGRFLKLKHPELPVVLAERLRSSGYRFVIDMFGNGVEYYHIKSLIEKKGLSDVVRLRGEVPNKDILKEMQSHEVFLFTSDRHEGWGAVINEAMGSGCAVVTSDCVGAAPYLIVDGKNGLVFESGRIDSLEEKVVQLLSNCDLLHAMRQNAFYSIRDLWNPKNAAVSLLALIEDLTNGRPTSIISGPCSIAEPII